MENEATIEIESKPEATTAAAPSEAELKANGWTPAEMERATKLGILPAAKVEENKEDKKVEPVVEKKEPPKPSGLPDFTMNAEQEKVFFQTFGPGTAPRAMYVGMKHERRVRQEAERKARDLEVQLKTLQAQPKVEEVEEVDDDKPLTRKEFLELLKQQNDAGAAQNSEQNERAQAVAAAHVEQEEYARSIYPDFDEATDKAKDVIANFETMFPEPWKQAKVAKMVRELQGAAANAHKMGPNDYGALHIAYEIGQMHPEYGNGKTEKPTATTKGPKENGLSPEQMKKVEENNSRRASSAALTGKTGKRTVSVEDIDLATLNGMDLARRTAFKDKYPERYAKLLRG